jgi:hypothetical protein
MPTELHDISLAIGELRADAEHARRSREVTHQRVEELVRGMAALTLRLEELTSSVRADVAAMKPEVQHYADTRRRIAGGIAVLVALAGAAGGLVGWLAGLPKH